MGYTLNPIAVDLKAVTGTLGSRDQQLLNTLVKKYQDEFKDIDDMVSEQFEDEGTDDSFTVRDAFRQMIMGEAYRTEFGFVYGYALEYLCSHIGEQLPNDWWRTTTGWYPHERADRALETAGVEAKVLRANRVAYRGSPVPLPAIDDFPAIGYMLVQEIRSALTVFDEATLAAVEDPDARGALGVLRGWLLTCSDRGRDLICFEG